MLDLLFYLLQFTQSEVEKASLSTSSAFTGVQIHYLALGLPANLSVSDRAALLQNISDLHCLLAANPPAGVDPLLIQSFQSTLKMMWFDAGGDPNGPNC